MPSTWRKSRAEIAEAIDELNRLDAEREETRREIRARLAKLNEQRARQMVKAAESRQGDLEEATAAADIEAWHSAAMQKHLTWRGLFGARQSEGNDG